MPSGNCFSSVLVPYSSTRSCVDVLRPYMEDEALGHRSYSLTAVQNEFHLNSLFCMSVASVVSLGHCHVLKFDKFVHVSISIDVLKVFSSFY